MNAATEKLTQASHRMAEVMYKAQQAAGSAGSGPSGQAGGAAGGDASKSGQGDVVDAEFVDVDESKKPN